VQILTTFILFSAMNRTELFWIHVNALQILGAELQYTKVLHRFDRQHDVSDEWTDGHANTFATAKTRHCICNRKCV